MAGKKFLKGSEEWCMFQDYWALCQRHWQVEDTDEFWEFVLRDIKEFGNKYKTEFAKDLAVLFYTELERKRKG